MADAPQPPAAAPPTIHEATLASGASGAVEWGVELTFDEAVALRRQALHVVVRGATERVNRRLAARIENAVGPASTQQEPHVRSAGPLALPHFHQLSRCPSGHTFYETKRRKARKRK
jgi:hypothetical protein